MGGVQALARPIAWFSDGMLNARRDFEASARFLLSKAVWFVCSVAIHYAMEQFEWSEQIATKCYIIAKES